MRAITALTVFGLACCLSAPITMAANEVGVTAAVNPQARGTFPSGSVRTLVLGDKVVFNERIDTTGNGLVQVLLTDGTTLTVGPNASLVIDEYVYQPADNSGKLAVSFGKGALRFIGGKLSKNDDSVLVNTHVGTIGIRGGMANIAVANNRGLFSLVFGKELTFTGRNGERSRVFEPGYSLEVVVAQDSGAATMRIRRTPASDIELFEQQLAGRPGQHGGARNLPNDGIVVNSSLPDLNSNIPLPRLKPSLQAQTVESTPVLEIERDLIKLDDAILSVDIPWLMMMK